MLNICDPLHQNLINKPNLPAIVKADGIITFKDLGLYVQGTASFLLKNGVSAGDRVGVCLGDHADHIIAMLAVARIGAVILPIDWRSAPQEKENLATTFNAKVVLVEPMTKSFSEVPTMLLQDCLKLGGSADCERFFSRKAKEPLLINFSSGSTGVPTGVEVTHSQFFARFVAWWTELELRRGQRYFSALPLAYSFGRNYLLYNLIAGNTVILYPPMYEDEELIQEMKSQGATAGMFTANVLRRLLKLSDEKRLLLPDLELLVSGAAPLHPEEKRSIRKRINPNFYEIYGHNGAGVISVLRPSEMSERSESVGRRSFLTEVQIVDDAGEEVPMGQAGQLRCRGPQVSLNVLEKESSSNRLAADQWCYTGEIAAIGDDGFIYLKDRADDLINYGGFSVYPLEIERVLMSHPNVVDTAVVGIPSDYYGQEVVAFVVLGHDIQVRELEIFCRGRLAHFKVPRRIFTVNQLPKSAAGKTLRRELIANVS